METMYKFDIYKNDTKLQPRLVYTKTVDMVEGLL